MINICYKVSVIQKKSTTKKCRSKKREEVDVDAILRPPT
jgi:hypothetical protein